MGTACRFTAELWRWQAQDGWFFVTLSHEATQAVRERPRPPPRGFGSVRVRATIGATTWGTSVFPESKSERFVLPVKRAVRVAAGVDEGDPVDVLLEILE